MCDDDNLHTHVIVPDNKSPVEKNTNSLKSSILSRPDQTPLPRLPWIKEPTGLWEVLPDSTSPSPRGYGECPARTSTP